MANTNADFFGCRRQKADREIISVLFMAGILLALAFTFGCSSNEDGNSTQGGCPNAATGNGTMSCGGQTYKTVVINDQTWMAENLNYAVKGSKCGNDNGELSDANTTNCDKYGRLYTWATAMDIDAKYNYEEWGKSDVKHKGICPTGWHIPNNADWKKLMRYADGGTGTDNCGDICAYESPTAGKYLKAENS